MSTIRPGISGIKAIDTKIQVNANNIANINTPNYKQKNVTLSEAQGGGVIVSNVSSSSAKTSNINSNIINDPNNSVASTGTKDNDVNLNEQVVDLKANELYFSANVQVVKVQDKTLGTLLDTFA